MTPEVEDAIITAANKYGINPAFALAVADRESGFNPDAHASKSIAGLYQMSGALRRQYGIGDSDDPYVQADGWGRFISDTRDQLAARLGREPTDPELYLAHYFGEGRAANLISSGRPYDVRDVFTPNELAQNPDIAGAGNTGHLIGSITGDISRRMANYGGYKSNSNGIEIGPDFASFGQPADSEADNGGLTLKSTSSQAIDFAQFGTPQVNVHSGQSTGQTGQSLGPMDAVRARANANDEGFDPSNVSAPLVPGQGIPDGEFGGTQARPIEGASLPGTEIDLSQFGLPMPAADVAGAPA